jgi:hypothetical protein
VDPAMWHITEWIDGDTLASELHEFQLAHVGPTPVATRVYGFCGPGLDWSGFFLMHSGDRIEFSCYSGTTVARGGGAATGQMPIAIVGLVRLLQCSIVVVLVCSCVSFYTTHALFSPSIHQRLFNHLHSGSLKWCLNGTCVKTQRQCPMAEAVEAQEAVAAAAL